MKMIELMMEILANDRKVEAIVLVATTSLAKFNEKCLMLVDRGFIPCSDYAREDNLFQQQYIKLSAPENIEPCETPEVTYTKGEWVECDGGVGEWLPEKEMTSVTAEGYPIKADADDEDEYTIGSGNVFTDLGFNDDDAARLTKEADERRELRKKAEEAQSQHEEEGGF